MLDLHAAFRNFPHEKEAAEPAVDYEFITNFLLPYFRNLPREQLEAKVAEVIGRDRDKAIAAVRRR